MMSNFKFDRNAFTILSFEEADKATNDHRHLTWQERLRLARYLISIAYGYVNNEEPKMDKTAFSIRKIHNA
jgi:hypothetical protein